MDGCKVIMCEEGFRFEASERETLITTDDIDKEWNVCTRQQKTISKLKKIGLEPYMVYMVGDKIVEGEYKVPYNQISFRKKSTKVFTAEERQKMGERLHSESKLSPTTP